MLLLCSCAFFFILNPKAFFSESFPFPMLFSSNFIIFMPVLHSSQRFRKSEILGLRFCVKSCGINRASQPTHGRRSYTLLISTKAVFSLFFVHREGDCICTNSKVKMWKTVEIRENHKIEIYENLSNHYYFEPVCVETLCSLGPHPFTWLKPNQNDLYTQKFTKSEILECKWFCVKSCIIKSHPTFEHRSYSSLILKYWSCHHLPAIYFQLTWSFIVHCGEVTV